MNGWTDDSLPRGAVVSSSPSQMPNPLQPNSLQVLCSPVWWQEREALSKSGGGGERSGGEE